MKAQRRYELAEQSLLMSLRNRREIGPPSDTEIRMYVHTTAKRYKLHEAQKRRLMAAARRQEEEGDGRDRW